jgi:hypothetical protein
VNVERSAAAVPVQLTLKVGRAAPIVQATRVIVSNPLIVSVSPPHGGLCRVSVENPSGEPFSGTVRARVASGAAVHEATIPLRFTAGSSHAGIDAPAPRTTQGGATINVAVADARGTVVVRSASVTFRPVDDFGRFAVGTAPADYRVDPDGDAKVASEQAITVTDPPAGPALPGLRSIRLRYRYAGGWKFVCVRPSQDGLRRIEGRPREFGVWIHGDGQGNVPRLRFVDSTQQTWQPDGDGITWKGWRWVTFPLDGTRCGRWGGADDGIIHYPIRWETLFLLDSPGGRATEGEVYVAGPTLIY